MNPRFGVRAYQRHRSDVQLLLSNLRREFTMATQVPGVGAWYRLNGGPPFEVVALDDDDGTIEVQYVDGTLEELDLEDWKSWCDEHRLEAADAGEDWSDSADVEADEGHSRFVRQGDNSDMRAGSLDDIDLFDVG